MSKSILITGCSSGIGLAAAHGLRAQGWRVFASCRQQRDCDRLRAQGFESPRIDYADADSISAGLSEVLAATGGTLDALFNNGAFGMPGAVEDVPTEGLRHIFEANFFGWHELTRLVIPVMRAQGHGRIVQCSSVLGLVAYPWRGAYTATKFALEGLSDTLRLELKGTGIHVVLIEPGPITSKLREKAIPHFERFIDWQNSALRDKYEGGLLKRLYEDRGPDRFELPPSAVTAKLIRALEARRPAARYYVTTPTYIAGILRRILPTRLSDLVLGRV
ncbi:SDR family NAD(P)-dependent oxidoreductase [Ruegeria aquimaris]|uniref:SDR family NAD(P)-dependent oxidoreductase n=1 Tax=Ruegeria aquimaris TaxID=2984333 RepID=A0ABT3AKV7_9RHOB|nr:SDR family NAD(P)-dependent oxidoreductase [Ruegeria sp. XHP0148]MCV2889317.1 SDR family NAD(P)-dependent oxidoreductase [Ruegeria sp. XHP0148]